MFFKLWFVLLLQQKDLEHRQQMQVRGLQTEAEFLGARPRDLFLKSIPGDSDLSVKKICPHLDSVQSESITWDTCVISCGPRPQGHVPATPTCWGSSQDLEFPAISDRRRCFLWNGV